MIIINDRFHISTCDQMSLLKLLLLSYTDWYSQQRIKYIMLPNLTPGNRILDRSHPLPNLHTHLSIQFTATETFTSASEIAFTVIFTSNIYLLNIYVPNSLIEACRVKRTECRNVKMWQRRPSLWRGGAVRTHLRPIYHEGH